MTTLMFEQKPNSICIVHKQMLLSPKHHSTYTRLLTTNVAQTQITFWENNDYHMQAPLYGPGGN